MSGFTFPTERERAPVSVLPMLGATLPLIAERFSEAGGVGLLLIDGRALRALETSHGAGAQERVFERLASVTRDACADALRPRDILLCGDPGRNEIVVLIFRSRDAGDFLRSQMAPLARRVASQIRRHANQIFYPYLRERAEMPTGLSVALRNPRFNEVTQIRKALEEARADAELNVLRATRARKRALVNLILNGRVRTVYEPIVVAESLTAFGYEALARGPVGTPLASPLAMFELAEKTDLVFDLDCLCRQRALEGALDFPAGTKLFVNIRPSAFHDPSFQPSALCLTLERSGLEPRDVVFEISEQESIENFASFRQARDDYGKLGFQFALDDTGSGYASFQSVLELAPEFVKVDRAFVAGIDGDPARRAILSGFQMIADQIGAKIIGEGLDTLEELHTLRDLGIPFGQGWLFGKPMPLRAGEPSPSEAG
ncbi:MAG: EAL domain-containing protein [Myxococcota bacterium]